MALEEGQSLAVFQANDIAREDQLFDRNRRRQSGLLNLGGGLASREGGMHAADHLKQLIGGELVIRGDNPAGHFQR
jgi:hypothetical protein